MRLLVQTSGMGEAERAAFLAQFQADNAGTLVGCAVLGGVFGEGIDLVGERLIGVAVVGVGLPQVCLERELIRQFYATRGGRGFEYAYQFPGMNRVLQAADNSGESYDFLISLQGDAPFTPASVLKALIDTISDNPKLEVITPVHRLSWIDLDALRDAKQTTPFSGTTCIRNNDGRALWFSKNIVPAIRDEKKMRGTGTISPVWQHMGVYGYRADILQHFVKLPQGTYEQLEGLEQLRFLENGVKVQTVEVSGENGPLQSGIDSPEDLARAEAHIRQFGDDLP